MRVVEGLGVRVGASAYNFQRAGRFSRKFGMRFISETNSTIFLSNL
jgi:hypothetical protein